MKYGLYISTLAAGAIMASCADEFEQTYSVKLPESIQEYSYLNEYQPLKEYLKAGSTVKLGGALEANDFNKLGVEYELAVSNFNEVVAGNAMKMSSCVDEKGNMNFGEVQSFVENAKAGGISVFGHTLAWHSQQPKKWLEKLIADKKLDIDPGAKTQSVDVEQMYSDGAFPYYPMGCEPPVVEGAIHFEPSGEWSQFFCCNGNTLEGDDYAVILNIQSSKEGQVEFTIQNGWGGDAQNVTKQVALKEGWQEVEVPLGTLEGGSYDCILKPGTFDAVLDLKKVTIVHYKAMAVEMEVEEHVETYTDGAFPFYAMGCEPPVVDGSLHFEPSGEWSQFFCWNARELNAGDYIVKLHIKSSKEGAIKLTAQNGWGSDAQNITGNVSLKEGWTDAVVRFEGIEGGKYDLILKPETFDATIDLNTITLYSVQSLTSLPLTAEEKKDTLVYAMEKWIFNMMAATKGEVKAWDVVNEAVSGADTDNDGYYDLQHAANVKPEDAANSFYWQDYLGDIDYVRTAVSAARRGFVAAGGNAEELKLFINDYNLESTWDANKKLKSLVNWISKWENDTIKIDGIGSQMHISCYENADKQKVQEDAVVNMLTIMAQTGKLVRISELDMNFIDEDGLALTTAEMSNPKDEAERKKFEEQHKAMANFYKFIIEKYFEIVPAAQQYGICQWCLTDSPDTDGAWRRAMPTGLWDRNYNRKHTYGGFADGLNNAKQ